MAAVQQAQLSAGVGIMTQAVSVGARSLYVDLTAWVGVLVAVLIALTPLLGQALGAVPPDLATPDAGTPVADYIHAWSMAAGPVLGLATLVAAVGLLLRLDWARRIFIGLLVLGVLGNVVGLWVQQEVVDAVVARSMTAANVPQQAASALGDLALASRASSAALTLVVCVAMIRAICRLMSWPVRQEFV